MPTALERLQAVIERAEPFDSANGDTVYLPKADFALLLDAAKYVVATSSRLSFNQWLQAHDAAAREVRHP
jgi:hypothetical protein